MIDCCQALWVAKYVLKPPTLNYGKRKALFTSVGAINSLNLFELAIVTVKSWFAGLGAAYAGNLLSSGIDGEGTIAKHPTAREKAFLVIKVAASHNWWKFL